MATDWKDALSSLRSSLDEPESSSQDENISDETNTNGDEKAGQKTPLTIITDKKGRNGKIATIVEGFSIPQNQVEEISRKLKQKLGVGGSVREGEILIQGNHKDAVKKFLESLNFKTKC